jgi:FMN-dependent oxidoreductase (nitrilotriacetate monooxygenase family)
MGRFHLGWFLGPGFGVQGWNTPGFGRNYPIWKPDLYVDALRTLERGMFDMLIIEDSSMVPNVYGASSDFYLKHGIMAPKHDPVPLTPLLSQATTKIGIVPTLTTTFYPPFLLARLMTTLDHITEGRIGWNIVTSTSHLSAQNYGMDRLPEHDERYDMADEFVELVGRLWDSWEPGAFVLDEATNTIVDGSKVHTIDFEGKYYKSRGPLNAVPGPQGRPVFVQAGGSPRGREFAAKYAETVIADAHSIDAMKNYRGDVRERMVRQGRNPDTCKVLFTCGAIIGRTEDEAKAKAEAARAAAAEHYEFSLAGLANITGIDFSKWDLDAPLPELTTNGSQSSLAGFLGAAEPGSTLRQVMDARNTAGVMGYPFIGTIEQIADQMGEVMADVGGDGFLFSGYLKPRVLAEIVDDLIPALQRRGLVRTEYPHDTFRANLMEF